MLPVWLGVGKMATKWHAMKGRERPGPEQSGHSPEKTCNKRFLQLFRQKSTVEILLTTAQESVNYSPHHVCGIFRVGIWGEGQEFSRL
jgi:hypothetical protein